MIYILAGQSSLAVQNIERFLHLNRQVLAQNKIIYPLNGYKGWSHQNLVLELMKSTRYDESYGSLSSLIKQIKISKSKNPKTNYIISLPSLVEAFQGLIQRLFNELTEADELKVIMILNYQLNYLYPFWYRERFVGLDKMKFHDWAKWRLACNTFGLNYLKVISKFKSTKQNVYIELIHGDHAESTSNLERNFMSIISKDPILTSQLDFNKNGAKNVFVKPKFCEDLVNFCDELYKLSNEKLMEIYPAMQNLNNLQFVI